MFYPLWKALVSLGHHKGYGMVLMELRELKLCNSLSNPMHLNAYVSHDFDNNFI